MNVNRVAFISFHACPLASPGEGKSGGMNVYARQLALALGNAGVHVDIFTRDHTESESKITEIAPGVRVIHLPGGPAETALDGLFPHLPEFSQALLEFQIETGLTYQAVHSHYWLSGWVGQQMATEWRAPHILTFHTLSLIKMQSRAGESEPATRQQVEKELMASADHIVAFSPHERDAMVRLYQADATRIGLIPCGVDLSLFRPLDQQEVREKLGLNGEKVLLYVGRIEPLKGLELLLHTAAQLQTFEQIRVLVVGGGVGRDQEIDRLRELAKSLNVDKVFDFIGRVDQQDLPLYYNAADVCVVPSFYESFGLAALESMACGTPVVATRAGGLSTIIQHGRTGYLKAWRCPEAFASSLEMIISSRNLQHSMGLAARRRAEGLSWDNVAGQIAGVYDSLITESR
ncbi:MAG: glycosyltransferase [Dehalococcoidia bacterium]|nr:glycosyltransferase [Dehalococcoidia bacterium]